MIYRHAFKVVDRTLRDFMKTVNQLLEKKLFENKVVIFEEDFYQILLVVIKGTHEDIIKACLC